MTRVSGSAASAGAAQEALERQLRRIDDFIRTLRGSNSETLEKLHDALAVEPLLRQSRGAERRFLRAAAAMCRAEKQRRQGTLLSRTAGRIVDAMRRRTGHASLPESGHGDSSAAS